MGREENIQVIRSFYASLKNSDFNAYFGLLHLDIEFRASGNFPLSGTWRGHEAVGKLAKGLFDLMEPGQCSWGETYRIVCADENGVAAITSGGGKTTLGHEYNQTYAHIFKICNNKIYRIYEFFDTVLAESALYGNDLNIPEKRPESPLEFSDEPLI